MKFVSRNPNVEAIQYLLGTDLNRIEEFIGPEYKTLVTDLSDSKGNVNKGVLIKPRISGFGPKGEALKHGHWIIRYSSGEIETMGNEYFNELYKPSM
jgi:hypothetical protein